MSAAVLVDTSALIAFFIQSERHHQAAKDLFLQHPNVRWLILSTVFDETVTWIRTKSSAKASIQIGHLLRTEHHYIPLSAADDLATWDAFCRYSDKVWSYTDCSLLVMAHRLNVLDVVAFDDHIRQMAGLGIVCLPSLRLTFLARTIATRFLNQAIATSTHRIRNPVS